MCNFLSENTPDQVTGHGKNLHALKIYCVKLPSGQVYKVYMKQK